MSVLHAGPVRPADAVPDATVRAAQRGDELAFAALYDAYAPRVFALCVGLAGNREAAAELVQDVFVRVWEGLASFRGDSAFSSWLHRLAVNVALEAKRKGQRRSLRVMIAADLESTHGAGPVLFEGPARTVDTALAIDLEDAIARLPAGARAVFVLHDVEGFRHDEIGERLGIAEGTSRAHLFRARRLLRETLER